MDSMDYNKLKEVIQDVVSGTHARTEEKFDLIDVKLDQIKEQTTKHNNRMSKAERRLDDIEKRELTHFMDCPVEPRVRKIEDDHTGNETTRKWITRTITILASVIMTVWVAMQVIERLIDKI